MGDNPDRKIDQTKKHKNYCPYSSDHAGKTQSALQSMFAQSNRAAERALVDSGILAATSLVYVEGKPKPAPNATEIKRHVKDLGSSDFQTRVRARRELERAAEAALPYLREAVFSDDKEVNKRANGLVDRISRQYDNQLPFSELERSWKFDVHRTNLEQFSQFAQLANIDRKTAERHSKTLGDLSFLSRDPLRVEFLLKLQDDYNKLPERQAAIANDSKRVERLSGSGSTTDKEVAAVRSAPNLDYLDLSHSDITDASGKHIGELKKLKRLDLSGTNFTDEGIAAIRHMKSLHGLGLSRTEITDAAMNHIKDLTELDILDVSRTKITDGGLEALKNLTKLKDLSLSGTKVSDKGVANLSNLTNLVRLRLGGTDITDASVKELKKLKNLDWLSLSGTKITAEGFAELRKALPDTTILGRPGPKP